MHTSLGSHITQKILQALLCVRNQAHVFTKLTQDRQCTYKLTMRRVRETIVVLEKEYVLHTVCVCVCV